MKKMSTKLNIHPLANLLAQILGLNLLPDPENTLLPSPWGQIIKTPNYSMYNNSLLNLVATEHPEIFDLLGNPLVLAGLNPQPFKAKLRYSQFVA
jgi:hypothetical protein